MALPQSVLSVETDLSDPHLGGYQDLSSLKESVYAFKSRYCHGVAELSCSELAKALQELTHYFQSLPPAQALNSDIHATLDPLLAFTEELSHLPLDHLAQALTELTPPTLQTLVQGHLRIQRYPTIQTTNGSEFNRLPDLNALLCHPHPETRLEAYQAVRHVLAQHNQWYGCLLNHLIQQRLRKSHSGVSFLYQQLQLQNHSPEAFESILEGTRERVDLFQRFYRLKAKITGRSVRICDLCAPWNYTVTLDPDLQEESIILQAFKEFHPDYGQRVRALLEQAGNPEPIPPSISLHHYNWAFSQAPHPLFTKLQFISPPASDPAEEQIFKTTLHQLLVLEACLRIAPDSETRIALLGHQLENQIKALFYQSLITQFELDLHAHADQAPLQPSFINETWLRLSQDLCGDAVELLPDHQFDWAEVESLFQQPFTCYTSTFGVMAALVCYQHYKQQGREFTHKYLQRLDLFSTGLESNLKLVGIDLENPVDIHQALDVIDGLMDQLEEALED